MTKTVMLFIGFLLILPILPWLPLGVSLKGKLIIAIESFAIAGAILLTTAYLPLWQSFLIGFLFFVMTGYFTVKYGLPAWAAEAESFTDSDPADDFSSQPKKPFGEALFTRKKGTHEPEDVLFQKEQVEKKPEPEEQKQEGQGTRAEEKDALMADKEDIFNVTKEPVQEADALETLLNEQDELEELTWFKEDHLEESTEKKEENELEELELLFFNTEADHKTAENVHTDDWLEEMNENNHLEVESDIKSVEGEEAGDLYLLELFEEEESEKKKETEIFDREEIPISDDKEREAKHLEETEKLNKHYLNDLLKEEFNESKAESAEESEDTIPELEKKLLLELEGKETEKEDIHLAEEDMVEENEVFLSNKEEQEEADFVEEVWGNNHAVVHSNEEIHSITNDSEAEEFQSPPRLSPEWLHLIVQEIEIKQKALPYMEAESVMQRYLQSRLHDRDYYVIARMLVAFYMANGHSFEAVQLLEKLKQRLGAYPVLIEEMKSIKEIILNQSVETGERDEEKQ
ncbi:hypothetical protein RRU94_13685 [Domibacillus sp. DTU_2020_1001157_1_SI_ALB_TIR_016]|uniref:hypothetical protein n=1 Tax=Domibacillus sp. DTU_2020_1001157_1_SI_ALB_TIR_016 TaxID=3077789 RepID=UPI0028EDAF5B|nr:hypothetical protein [Domibacillus sp. DTU_2020_1001157_1_SI_ALB_TIR_016]WNS81809.1 hypothetical protein RRU94_13685 [Domibacillus sp. DTU_2020_1001157_1_SI_ALB_TIR_016]